MINIAKRNLKIYFRQKSTVFFSLMSVFIIILLYVLFLGKNLTSSLDANGINGVENLVNSWVMAGIISVASITTTMGAFNVMVEDRVKNLSKDFFSSPIKKVTIVGGYVLSSYIVGFIMSVITFIAAEVYISISGGEILSFTSVLKVLGIILISVFMSSSLVFFIVSFFYSQGAFSTASTIIGTLIGFVTGIYFPISVLSNSMQWLIKLFPLSHSAALLRQVMMTEPIRISFENAGILRVNEFKESMGIILKFGDYTLTPAMHILILLVVGIIFFILAVLNISRKSKRV
ncbi:ABC transporter permease [Anaerofustis stercorihominis]|uniref:ABC-2 type transporter n=3 Tax=Anaerofustis stercorihominis TaxID=214853 RepID=B1C6S1_9FIRM|nr:ABC transporter permease [Anaerofustis stercorihominis]EDS72708.1 ABC-2 type transporter [Anaerofustis stercorihominis DSM 17244]MCQ4794082.1 ABC transporter permease [Anaerofustis stercorihominis]RGD74616.1 ABC transporter permease [Anaerofustis stercorihominis]